MPITVCRNLIVRWYLTRKTLPPTVYLVSLAGYLARPGLSIYNTVCRP